MKKVILNKCYSGFGLSPLAHKLYAKKLNKELFAYKYDFDNNIYRKVNIDNDDPAFRCYFTKDFGDIVNNISDDDWNNYSLSLDKNYREDPILIEVVEKLGIMANNGPYSKLRIVEIPDDLDYVIDEYDGIETLHQKVQEW